MVHRETRKFIFNIILENGDENNLKNILLEANNIYSNNIHSITKFKPFELISNTDESICKLVYDNIK